MLSEVVSEKQGVLYRLVCVPLSRFLVIQFRGVRSLAVCFVLCVPEILGAFVPLEVNPALDAHSHTRVQLCIR